MRAYKDIILFGLLVILAARCFADPPIEMVLHAKQATALVSVEVADGIDEGSAFCIDAAGLFVTNAHVVEGLKPGGKLVLVLHSGETDQVKLPANIVKMDKGKDLAVLQIVHPKNLIALTLGSVTGLVETMPVVAFGYPFGTDLALKDGDFPSITVSTGHISSLRKIAGELAAIQLDASLNEGNSGGPIIDSKGEVIAIVAAGIPGSGINLAIPVSDLRAFLSSLNIVFTPPVARAGHLRDQQEFKIELLNPPHGKERAVVEITLTSGSPGSEDRRTVRAETDDGRNYAAEMSLLRNLPTDIPDSVSYQIKATLAGKVIASEKGEISLEGTLSTPADTAFVYEGFAYAAGSSVEGQGGGKGSFSGAWTEGRQGSTPSMIADRGLSFGNLKTTGKAIITTSNLPVGEYRSLQTSPGKMGTALFISFLIDPLDPSRGGQRSAYFGFVYGGIQIGEGGSTGVWGLEHSPGGGGRVNSRVPIVTGQTSFLVVRITFGAENENDKVDLFINPTPGRPLPAVPDATKSDQNTGKPRDFNVGGNILCVYDEIRFGDSFAEVAPTK